MDFSLHLKVQFNPSYHTFSEFRTNLNNTHFYSCRDCCLHWRRAREGRVSLVVAAPLHLSSSRLVLLSATPSAYPPSHSLSESLESDAIPKIETKFTHNDSCRNEEMREEKRRKRKPRPSFNDLTMQRWSHHSPSQRNSFPWQTQHHDSSLSPSISPSPSPSCSPFHSPSSPSRSSSRSSPLHDLNHSKHNHKLSLPNSEDKRSPQVEVELFEGRSYAAIAVSSSPENQSTPHKEIEADSHSQKIFFPGKSADQMQTTGLDNTTSGKPTTFKRVLLRDSASSNVTPSAKTIPILSEPAVRLPWVREKKLTTDTSDQNQNKLRRKKSNTEMAEQMIPELELQRLRDAALRMKEMMKVGAAGVTEAVVQAIHSKWKEEEVVKLRFKGPPSLHMMRTHQILESKTGGIVIWRSGRSVVLYRGMGYEFTCVKSYATSKSGANDQNQNPDRVLPDNKPSFLGRHWNQESTSAATESLLDELGPRYKDWSGWDPVPVDADLLPCRVPAYKPPYRMIPFKTRTKLRDAEMTSLRQLARSIAPHFALGRNREHQGLAAAIVKLWDKSAIAKIAIKRGVPNTSNEIMAEELKKLTGGTLVSRNKEYIVLYRGNDFLTASVRATLVDKQNQAVITQEEEELSRQKALDFLSSDSRPVKGRLVAGTLAETTEAASRWGRNQNLISDKEREAMRRDFAVSKHASLIRLFERKLYLAKVKFATAERALAKVQEALLPKDLPTDLETVTDEERAKFRSIGLKMNSFLSLGRREVFDGTVQNIHLNWKNKELVKVIVKRKNFLQVKHIAISLEAESGGVLISLDKTTKGYAIILYRGKNYYRPHILRPKNLLTGKQALERSIELQRREALKHHLWKLQGKIRVMKEQLEQMSAGMEIQGNHFKENLSDESDDDFDDEGEEAYLKTYDMGDEDSEDNGSDSAGDDQIAINK